MADILTPDALSKIAASSGYTPTGGGFSTTGLPPSPTPSATPTVAPKQTSLAEDQTKASNQGKPGFDTLGNPIPGYQAPSTDTSTTGGIDTSTDQGKIDYATKQQNDVNAQLDTSYKQFSDTITGITNGTIPLTPGEQAQVTGLQLQYQQMIDQQKLINTGASGTANIRGYQQGAGEYDPTFQANTIGAIVTAGNNKVMALNTQMASAVAALTQSLRNNDITNIKTQWDELQQYTKDRNATLQKTVDDAQARIKSVQDEIDKQKTYDLEVDKFNQTKDQNAFKNAFDLEQQKFNEAKDTQSANQAAASLAETTRHNKASEAIDAFKAGQGAGGGSGLPGITQSATLTASGNPDPVSQKAVLDNITQQYGPMTAIAIKGLTDYSINPADWATRMVKGGKGMTREEAVTLAKMVDPTYNDAMYSVRATYMKNLASAQQGTIGGAVNSANKSINHLTAFVTSMSQLPNGISSTANAFDNAVTLNQGVRQTLNTAKTEGLGVADELAKFFKGTGTSDVASVDAWKNQLSTNASPADVKGLTQGAITLLSGQLESLSEQYKNTMGKESTNNFLGQSALANLSKLKNQGYTVDIPGVNYTDKDAYYKYGGGSPDKLIAAHDYLVKLNDPNNPPTPENALELAQLQ